MMVPHREVGAAGAVEVVGLGYCVYDILAIVGSMPDFDDVDFAHVSELVHDGGGQVGTAITTLARLGARAGYLGVLGDDREGRWLRDLFARDGVDTTRLRLDGRVGTNVCLILVSQATAGRAFLCHRRVDSNDLALDDRDREYIQSARVLHLDGQFMPAAIQAARWAKQAGARVCYDGNHPRPRLEELLPLVDWLIVAESFAAGYTGRSDVGEAAARLLDLGVQVLVVTRGEQGCQVWTATEHFEAAGHVVEPVDTTGAGDAFHGAFVYAMLQGWGLRPAARFANAVAAINCRTLGGRRGLPSLDQIMEELAWASDLPGAVLHPD